MPCVVVVVDMMLWIDGIFGTLQSKQPLTWRWQSSGDAAARSHSAGRRRQAWTAKAGAAASTKVGLVALASCATIFCLTRGHKWLAWLARALS